MFLRIEHGELAGVRELRSRGVDCIDLARCGHEQAAPRRFGAEPKADGEGTRSERGGKIWGSHSAPRMLEPVRARAVLETPRAARILAMMRRGAQ
jgi:hypothetical protein